MEIQVFGGGKDHQKTISLGKTIETEELLKNTEWKSSAARTRDFSTGASHVKYDKEGKMKLQGNQGQAMRFGYGFLGGS